VCDIKFKGENIYYPTKSRAFKLNDRVATTSIVGCEWTTGKTGTVSPVVLLQPVELLDTTVSRASGYNAKLMKERNYSIGAEVTIVKSGDIIPRIVEVTKASSSMVELPTNCPSCNNVLEMTDNELVCTNTLRCPAQLTKILYSFLQRMKVGGASDKSLLNWGVYTFDDLIGFLPDIMSKSQNTFYDEVVNKIIYADPIDILVSLPFSDLGTKTMRKLIDFYGLKDLHYYASKREYPKKYPVGVGELTFGNIFSNWNSNMQILNTILRDARRVNKPVEEKVETSDKLNGSSFCVTGKLVNYTRNQIEDLVRNNGGTVLPRVTKKLTYLITNTPDSGTTKNKKAAEYGTLLLPESQFLEMIK
jgi:DNA ligase (NAD+)